MKHIIFWIIFISLWVLSLVLTYNLTKERYFKEGQDFIAFTNGENREEIIQEIIRDRLKEGMLK